MSQIWGKKNRTHQCDRLSSNAHKPRGQSVIQTTAAIISHFDTMSSHFILQKNRPRSHIRCSTLCRRATSPAGTHIARMHRTRDVSVQNLNTSAGCIGISRGRPRCGARVTESLIPSPGILDPGEYPFALDLRRALHFATPGRPSELPPTVIGEYRTPCWPILHRFTVCDDSVPGSGGLRIWRGPRITITRIMLNASRFDFVWHVATAACFFSMTARSSSMETSER